MSTTILHVCTMTRTSPGAILAGATGPGRAIAAVPGLIRDTHALSAVTRAPAAAPVAAKEVA